MADTQIGHTAEVIPLQRAGELTREDVHAAVRLWKDTREVAECLSPAELGALKGFDRMDAQRKAILLGLSHYYRAHDRADVAPGVAVIIALFSDNERGLASISQPTLATLFGRSRSAIGDAQKRLKDDGIIAMTRGRYAGAYPLVPRSLIRQRNHMTWLLEALNADAKPLNLPAPPADCQSTGPTGGLSQSTGPTGALKFFNQPVEPVSINRPDATQLHYKNSLTTLDKAAAVVAASIATTFGVLPAAAEPPKPPAIIQPAKLSLADMTERMVEAAGPALANPAACPGLLTFADLQRWLRGGCDLEDDILPAIRGRCARARPGSIRSWSYFEGAVSEAKASRDRPMETPRAAAPPIRQFAGRKKTIDEMTLDELREYYERGGT